MGSLIALAVFIFIMYTVMKHTFKTIFGIRDDISSSPISQTSSFPFRFLNRLILSPFQNDGLMGFWETNKFFQASNKGLLIDGNSKRLSEKDSFNHLAVIARSGAGKTTTFIIPNIFRLAQTNSSMVITDLSGEIYQQTSGYLTRKGYKVYVLDPERLDESIRYNPMYYASNATSIDEMADVLLRSAIGGQIRSEDKVWIDGAKTLISIFTKTLINTRDYRYINLANLRYLINNYGNKGTPLDNLMFTYADNKTLMEWKGFVSGNDKTVLSYVATANTALNPIGINDNLELLTANHTINFENFRKEKSVLYIRIPAQKQSQYSFLLNLVYTQFFNTMMQKLPSKNDLPIYCLLDEFGNMAIPNFSSIITTIRKYKVSISIILQDFAQLQLRYGDNEAHTILNGGISGKIFFNGADHTITQMLEEILGTKIIEEDQNGLFHKKEVPVLSARDIRTMKDNEILFIYANKLPLKLKTIPYYKHSAFNSYSKIAPQKIQNIFDRERISYIDLRNHQTNGK